MNVKRQNVTVVDHPLVQHKLTLMRKRETTTVKFRQLSREVSTLLAYEVTRDLPLTTTPIETPLAEMTSPALAGKKLCVVSILRAGDGLLPGMLDLVPSARVGHVGIYRDPESLTAVEYYFKVPEDLQERLVIVVDPMLATGNSAVAAVSRLKEDGALA
jgi:uracil phosphoribosyltransferase